MWQRSWVQRGLAKCWRKNIMTALDADYRSAVKMVLSQDVLFCPCSMRMRSWVQRCEWVSETLEKDHPDRVAVRHHRVINSWVAHDPAPLIPGKLRA